MGDGNPGIYIGTDASGEELCDTIVFDDAMLLRSWITGRTGMQEMDKEPRVVVVLQFTGRRNNGIEVDFQPWLMSPDAADQVADALKMHAEKARAASHEHPS